MIDRHIGRFTLSADLLDSEPRIFWAVLSECIVVRCELMYGNEFEYTGISERFEEVPEGEAAPFYHAELFHQDGRTAFMGWKKR